MERYIGILKGIVRSMTHIDMNLANMVLTMEHRNWLFLRYQLKSQLEDVNTDQLSVNGIKLQWNSVFP